jgi:phenylalanyl-tRNA synthetase beta chain
MLVCLNWLREFTPYEGTAQELGDRLTMLGLELEDIRDPFADIREVVVGFVAECGPHPEADKLSVCTVDVGSGDALTIVCGAPNVAKGQKVAVATIGSTLPGEFKIKKAKLRGVPSEGMICSERELGISDAHEGIMVLPDDARVGARLAEALGLEDTVLDIDITPNRADCLSVLGIARETSMAFGLPFSLPDCAVPTVHQAAHRPFPEIDIADAELCHAFRARFITGVSIQPSPLAIRQRLIASGVRPISNIVDVTNYILMEMGQPTHSFDWDLLRGDVMRAKPATEGMRFTTLDGQNRTLTAQDLVIWDGERAVGLAGVMGGQETEINAGSRNVLLECAVFRPGTIRKTARRLALPSEASYRYERGVDINLSPLALDRAARLMAELGGGQVLEHVAASVPSPWKPRVHRFRRERCEALVGIPFTPDFCKTTFLGLGCEVDDADPADWKVTSPSHRQDLEREVDLYEEVARVHGLDRIPPVLPRVAKVFGAPAVADTPYGWSRRLKAWALGAGLREAINYSFVGHGDLDAFGLPEEGRVSVSNPLSEDQNVMRTELAPGMLTSIRNNLAKGNNRLRLFEVAKIFLADPDSDTTCTEHTRLSIALHGNRHAASWPWPDEEADYLDLKGLVEHLLDSLKLEGTRFLLSQGHPYLEPCVALARGDDVLGVLGQVRPEIADRFHAKKPVWLAELDADHLRTLASEQEILFQALPVFPPSRRDVTFRCPVGVHAGDVLAALEARKPGILESTALVAEYVPDNTSGERNLSFRLTYRHPSKTLKDKEVDKAHAKVVEGVLTALSVSV